MGHAAEASDFETLLGEGYNAADIVGVYPTPYCMYRLNRTYCSAPNHRRVHQILSYATMDMGRFQMLFSTIYSLQTKWAPSVLVQKFTHRGVIFLVVEQVYVRPHFVGRLYLPL